MLRVSSVVSGIRIKSVDGFQVCYESGLQGVLGQAQEWVEQADEIRIQCAA